MHETSSRGWCTGKTHRDGVGREVGGRIGIGNTCKSMADSCQCIAKTTTICKVINLQLIKINGKKKTYDHSFPCGLVVKYLSDNARDTGSILGPRWSHMPQLLKLSSRAQAMSPRAKAAEASMPKILCFVSRKLQEWKACAPHPESSPCLPQVKPTQQQRPSSAKINIFTLWFITQIIHGYVHTKLTFHT